MDLSLRALKEALEIRQQIDELENRLIALFNPAPAPRAAIAGRPRRISAAGRARISAAAKARWAKARGTQATAPLNAGSRKRGITAVGRKRLSEMMKARWAAKKATRRQ